VELGEIVGRGAENAMKKYSSGLLDENKSGGKS